MKLKNLCHKEASTPMSITVSPTSIKGKERKEIIEKVQNQIKEAVVQATQQVVMACLEAEVSAQLGREKGKRRNASEQPRSGDWKCGHCGCQDANQFTRDGHYQRTLETKCGHIDHLQVPMLECQKCHHDVICQFSILDKFQRFWIDMHQDAFFSSGLGQSLRAIRDRWSGERNHPVGLRSINELINQVEPLIHRMREQQFQEAPMVVQCDGIWVTVMGQEEAIKLDKRRRKRRERRGKKVVILVALGFWPDGKREIVDWQLAKSEDHAQWEPFLKRLKERGIGAEKGLKMIVRDGCGGLGKALANVYGNSILDQRCIFHKLKNVADKASTDFKGKEQRHEMKKELMKQAAHIYEAEHADIARERLHAWAQAWQSQAPLAVATLERDFEDTLVYYQLDTAVREWIRTTSLLERTNRELRRKFRQAVSFGSSTGADVALFLQVKRLHARWTNVPWWQVSHDLCFELYP
jgi:transposase-like protein